MLSSGDLGQAEGSNPGGGGRVNGSRKEDERNRKRKIDWSELTTS